MIKRILIGLVIALAVLTALPEMAKADDSPTCGQSFLGNPYQNDFNTISVYWDFKCGGALNVDWRQVVILQQLTDNGWSSYAPMCANGPCWHWNPLQSDITAYYGAGDEHADVENFTIVDPNRCDGHSWRVAVRVYFLGFASPYVERSDPFNC